MWRRSRILNLTQLVRRWSSWRQAGEQWAEPPPVGRPGGGFMDKLMTLEEVAAHLGKPRSWVYGNWRKEEIPFRKVGQALRCRPRDLDKWLDGQGVK
ncbi:helix-turn-helix domain-containing protein [Streptomyces phaeochromogenes]|uniref:helix-turn-helix domain-containing protein n=1 Tax=Streptomyces phaeochromogenes TaxID=1923 RepID=UPI0033E8EA30